VSGRANPNLDAVVVPRARDIGGFEVRRALPAVERRAVGPFVFLDQMGPAHFLAGSVFGARSPVHVLSDLFYADVALGAGASLPLDPEHEERALYLVEGEVEIAGDRFEPGRLLVFRPGDRMTIKAITPARFMLLGGAALDGPRHMWWNFVSSRKDRIEQAKEDWKAGRFGTVPGDDAEFIPLPEA
jgi:redox-sensitive bicupin YhaK (pirin superfamily)